MLDIRSISDENPSGSDPEYDADFQALEQSARPAEDRQIGGGASEDPDFRDVARRAAAILERCHDLRAALYLTRAETVNRGYPGLADGTGYIRGVLDQFWDTCHPGLDMDDPEDMALFRVNTLRGLTETSTTLRAVRRAPLAQSSMFGRLCLADLELIDGEREPAEGETPPNPSNVAATFQDTDAGLLAEIAAAARMARDNVRAIEALFDEKVPGRGPDLSALARLLHKAVQRLNEATGTGEGSEAGTAPDLPAPAGAAPAAAAVASAPGTISNQKDVQRALDRILDYYRIHEPSSPLPILLERAKRLVGADFITIMKDMAPLGVENVYLIGGIEEAEE